MPGMTPDPGNGPADNSGTDGTEGTAAKRRATQRRGGRPSKLQKVEDRLNEMFAGVAVAQQGLGVVSGDPRHIVGGDVTAKLAPPMIAAWVKLAQENPRVEAVLLRMSETSAWGEVILATSALAYSQAQVYGAVPTDLPNPWVDVPVPPSADVAAAYQQPPPPDWTPPAGDDPITGRQPPRSGVDSDENARNVAEAQRRAAEQQRLQRLGGQG